MKRAVRSSVGILIGCIWFASGTAAEDGGYPAHGTVKSVDVEAQTVTIDHEDIPGLMMGMAMKFEVSEPGILSGVAPGQVVDFRVRKDGERYFVTEIRIAATGRSGRAGTGQRKDTSAPAGK